MSDSDNVIFGLLLLALSAILGCFIVNMVLDYRFGLKAMAAGYVQEQRRGESSIIWVKPSHE